MEWIKGRARFGDMIRVRSDEIYHYGIYVSESEIIQFGKNPKLLAEDDKKHIIVCSTSINEFSCGEQIEVAVYYKRNNAPDKTVAIARSKLGEGGYDFLYNNCEHFANFCCIGEVYSSQTEELRKKFLDIPILDVYIARLPDTKDFSVPLCPKERNDEVCSVSSEQIKAHKYYVWRLLEKALLRTFGYKIDKLSFYKDKRGKWNADSFKFSLSHSGNYVAVALSRNPVGVDIQILDNSASVRLAKKVLTDDEYSEYLNSDESLKYDYLITKWTAKEAIFKSADDGYFSPSQIEVKKHSTESKIINSFQDRYILSVYGTDINKLRIIDNILLD